VGPCYRLLEQDREHDVVAVGTHLLPRKQLSAEAREAGYVGVDRGRDPRAEIAFHEISTAPRERARRVEALEHEVTTVARHRYEVGSGLRLSVRLQGFERRVAGQAVAQVQIVLGSLVARVREGAQVAVEADERDVPAVITDRRCGDPIRT